LGVNQTLEGRGIHYPLRLRCINTLLAKHPCGPSPNGPTDVLLVT
jgi:hypothetical protein